MFCNKCGNITTSNDKFCNKCGNAINMQPQPIMQSQPMEGPQLINKQQQMMNQENNNIKMIMAIIIVIIMLYASIDKTLYKGTPKIQTKSYTIGDYQYFISENEYVTHKENGLIVNDIGEQEEKIYLIILNENKNISELHKYNSDKRAEEGNGIEVYRKTVKGLDTTYSLLEGKGDSKYGISGFIESPSKKIFVFMITSNINYREQDIEKVADILNTEKKIN